MIDTIFKEIDGEIARLQQARSLLTSLDTPPVKRGPGRPPTQKPDASHKSKRRTMSPEAREKIRQAQVKRWAATKKKS